jgi:CRP-like cAMP-binding protein
MEAMAYFEIPAGTTMFEQATPGKLFFVLVAGTVDVVVNGKRVHSIGVG